MEKVISKLLGVEISKLEDCIEHCGIPELSRP